MMTTSYVAAGQGNNPKAPPPTSILLKAYTEAALRVQDCVDELFDVFDFSILLRLHSALDKMRHVYSEMNALEREIVDGSHIPLKLVDILFSQVDVMINQHLTGATTIEEITDAAKVLSDILYTYQESENITCSYH